MRIDSTKTDGSPSDSSIDYVERVNRAIDYVIRKLDHPLCLDEVAQVACFSPFHFHRIFKSLVGETLNQFIRRLRLERALFLMSHGGSRSLTDIAFLCGFSSSSDFSRSFKQRYGVAPSAFDISSFRAKHRAELQTTTDPERHHRLDRLPPGENPDGFAVTLLDLPPRSVAYIRVFDPYTGTKVVDATTRLVEWAQSQGCADGQWLGYMWDDPEIVALKDCRYDVGVVVSDFEPSGDIGRFEFPAMRIAQVPISGGIDLELRALDWLFGTWLPRSGYTPTEHPSFEAWCGLPFAHGFETFELSVQLPVSRA